MIRWGILGAGNIAHRFARSLQNEEDSILYAISGRSQEKLDVFQQVNTCECCMNQYYRKQNERR